MSTSRDEILDAALRLPEVDRLLIATQLMETLPNNIPGLSDDDPGFLEELERRANDRSSVVPLSELWEKD